MLDVVGKRLTCQEDEADDCGREEGDEGCEAGVEAVRVPAAKAADLRRG